jgi:hypothetical protein
MHIHDFGWFAVRPPDRGSLGPCILRFLRHDSGERIRMKRSGCVEAADRGMRATASPMMTSDECCARRASGLRRAARDERPAPASVDSDWAGQSGLHEPGWALAAPWRQTRNRTQLVLVGAGGHPRMLESVFSFLFDHLRGPASRAPGASDRRIARKNNSTNPSPVARLKVALVTLGWNATSSETPNCC